MKRYKWFLALVYALFLASWAIIGYTQNDEELTLEILSFSSVYTFDTETEHLVSQKYSKQFYTIFDPYFDMVSPSGRYRISWESNLSSGLWVTDNTSPNDTFNFSVDIQDGINEVQINWLFNEQLAIISVGIPSDTLALTPKLEVNQIWLFNAITLELTNWYWDCNTVIHLESSNRLAMLCELLAFANDQDQPQNLILNFDGSITQQPTDYSVVYTFEAEFIGAFSQDAMSIAFVDDTNVISQKVNVYDVKSQKIVTVDTYNATENAPIGLRFSPLDSQLAVFKTCQIYFICSDIYNTSNFSRVLASHELTGSDDIEFMTKSIYWTEDENTLFILTSANQTSLLWALKPDNMEVISTWELISGLEHIIGIENEG